jgi:prepilin-type N-terminal cleavage/methylation domain-containing protein
MSKMCVGTRKGFTLVELAVVIVIIGVLAAFGVPRFLQSVERSKASEAFQYLAAVRSAQERYLSKEGVYASNLSNLDITQNTPKYFTIGALSVTNPGGGSPTWTMTLTRIAATSSYGDYTVIFTQDGFSSSSTITAQSGINPMGT